MILSLVKMWKYPIRRWYTIQSNPNTQTNVMFSMFFSIEVHQTNVVLSMFVMMAVHLMDSLKFSGPTQFIYVT